MLGWFSLVVYASGERTDAPNPSPVPSPPPSHAMQEYCTLFQKLNLLRGVICHVTRAFVCLQYPSVSAWSSGRPSLPSAGRYVHFVGSPAFRLVHMLDTFCRLLKYRNVPKNHSLSRTMGPPNDGLTSHSFLIELVAVSPEPSMLLPCNASPVPLMKKPPAKVLPPCLVTMFICGPPVVA